MKKFNFNQMNDVARLLSMATDAKAMTVITIGAKAVENQLVCGFRSTAEYRQITLRVTCAKPKDWDGTALQLVVSTPQLISTIQTLGAFKDDKMYIQVNDNHLVLGVEGKAKIKLGLLAETPVEMKPGAIMARFAVKDGFETFLRKGCGCAAQSREDAKHLNNVVFVLNTDNGDLSAISAGPHAMARSKTSVQMAPANADVQNALNAYCANEKAEIKCTPQDLTLCVPAEGVNMIRNLISGVKNTAFAADENHLWVQAGQNVMFCVTREQKTSITSEWINQVMSQKSDAVCSVDVEAFARAISLCSKVASIAGVGAVNIEITKGVMKVGVGTGKNKDAETVVPLLDKTDSSTSVYVNSKQVESLLNLLDRGGLEVRFAEPRLMYLRNKNDELSDMAVCLVRAADAQRATEPEKTEESANEGDEAELNAA